MCIYIFSLYCKYKWTRPGACSVFVFYSPSETRTSIFELFFEDEIWAKGWVGIFFKKCCRMYVLLNCRIDLAKWEIDATVDCTVIGNFYERMEGCNNPLNFSLWCRKNFLTWSHIFSHSHEYQAALLYNNNVHCHSWPILLVFGKVKLNVKNLFKLVGERWFFSKQFFVSNPNSIFNSNTYFKSYEFSNVLEYILST